MLATHLRRQWFAVGFEKSVSQGQQGFGGRFDHLAVKELDDGQAEAVVFNDDIGEGPVHGTEGSQRFRGKAVEHNRCG